MASLAEEIELAVASALREVVLHDAYRRYTGPYAERLMEGLVALHGGGDILLASSGTAALEIALRAAGIGPGCEVVVSAYDYPGNFWAIERTGARPLLIDLEPSSWRMDLSQLDSLASQLGAIKAVVASHLHGELQPLHELKVICDRHGWLLIEDNCQALGSYTTDGIVTGTLGDLSIFSFGGGKVISAGRGGGLALRDERLLHKCRLAAGAGSGPYAMSELQAIVAAAQLPLLARHREEVSRFFAAVDLQLQNASTNLLCPMRSKFDRRALYQVGWILPDSFTLTQRDELVQHLSSEGIAAGSGFAGFHRRSGRRCRSLGPLPMAAKMAERTCVLHHRQVTQGGLSPQEVAKRLHRAILGVTPA